MLKIIPVLVLLVTNGLLGKAQSHYSGTASEQFDASDSLRGYISELRSCFDVNHYGLNISVDIEDKWISGWVDILFTVREKTKKIQLDLLESFDIEKIIHAGNSLNYSREERAIYVGFSDYLEKSSVHKVRVEYSGSPPIAQNAPWDGGWTWSKTENGAPWIGIACQGDGASYWYPNKDHWSDEPDSADIMVAVPQDLVAVCNGKLINKNRVKGNMVQFHWSVKSSINNYNITINIAPYVYFSWPYTDIRGEFRDLDFYVLPENLEKASNHFRQVEGMMKCFENSFGEYPFWKDGYKLVETPYLGMEHQSAIAYGNGYKAGYKGLDLSGLGWDYIIVHESGHEWFGNSISANDVAHIWLHESITTYSEAVYVECISDFETVEKYLLGQSTYIKNEFPITGVPDVGDDPSERDPDVYYKGSRVFHTLRMTLGNDELWWKTLREYAESFAHSIIDTETAINYFASKLPDIPVRPIMEQYLHHAELPVLNILLKRKANENHLILSWESPVPGFWTSVAFSLDGQEYIVDFKKKNKITINLGEKNLEDIEWNEVHTLCMRKMSTNP